MTRTSHAAPYSFRESSPAFVLPARARARKARESRKNVIAATARTHYATEFPATRRETEEMLPIARSVPSLGPRDGRVASIKL